MHTFVLTQLISTAVSYRRGTWSFLTGFRNGLLRRTLGPNEVQHNLYYCPNIISKGQLNQKHEMYEISSGHWSDQKFINTSAGKSKGLRSLARYGCRWKIILK
jgi:hypothetical protein